jgi:hypothetical protein
MRSMSFCSCLPLSPFHLTFLRPLNSLADISFLFLSFSLS